MEVIMETKEELLMAYLAGVLDADGSFSLCKSAQRGKNPGPSPLYYPVIQLSKVYESLIDLLMKTFKGRKHVRKPYVAKDGGTRKTNYHWLIQRVPSCQPMLEKITPYLILKKERALFLLNFLKDFPFKRGSNVIKPEILVLKEKAYLRMKQFNDERTLTQKLTSKFAVKDSDSPLFWSYLAGYMDTDGSFSVTIRRTHTNMVNHSYGQLIQISSIDLKSLNYICENFVGCKVCLSKGANCTTGFIYKLSISKREDVIRFCKNLIPYLRIKKEQAKILLDFCLRYNKVSYCKGGILPEILQFRHECYEKVKKLNNCDLYKPTLIEVEG